MKRLVYLAAFALTGCAYQMDSAMVSYDNGPLAASLTEDKGPLVTVTFTKISIPNAKAKANRTLADEKAALRCGKEGLEAEFLSTSEHDAQVDSSWFSKQSSANTFQFFYACVAVAD